MFQPCVYHQCKISKIIHPEILSEEVFGEFYTFSDYPSDIYASVSEDGSSSEHSSESDDVNIRPTKRQKTLVIDSDTEVSMKLIILEKAPLHQSFALVEDNIS